jgi:AraC-like DNA-binding protein
MHDSSILRPGRAVKRQSATALFVSLSFAVALIGATASTLVGVVRFKDLERDALLILSDWQSIDALTNDVLLKRASLSDGGTSRLLGDWERRTLDFSLSLARFNDDRRLAPLGGLEADVEGAVGLWLATEGRVSAAQRGIRSMIRSGLASRVMVNGFLPTFYQLRMEKLLSQEEILRIDEAISALEILDTTTAQFDQRLRTVVSKVGIEVRRRIFRIAVLSVLIAATTAVGMIAGAFSYRAYRRSERRRREGSVRLRQDYLADLFLNPDVLKRNAAERALRELGCLLPFAPGQVLCLVRYDRPGDGSPPPPLEELVAASASAPGPRRESFAVAPDTLALLVEAPAVSGESAAQPAVELLSALRAGAAASGFALSCAVGSRFGPDADRASVLEDALSILSYRYLFGPGAFLKAADLPPLPEPEYVYPAKAEEILTKRVLEADAEGAKSVLSRILDDALMYPPTVLRAVVARAAASLFAAIERLERAADFTLPSASFDRLSEIAQLDTLASVRGRFDSLLDQIASAAAARRNDRVGETVARAEAIIAAEYADPNLSAEGIAERLGLSAGYFSRSYRKATGRSAADAINEVRCAAGAKLLKETGMTVEAVASAVGIPNAGSFYRLFKSRSGLTPNEARTSGRSG